MAKAKHRRHQVPSVPNRTDLRKAEASEWFHSKWQELRSNLAATIKSWATDTYKHRATKPMTSAEISVRRDWMGLATTYLENLDLHVANRNAEGACVALAEVIGAIHRVELHDEQSLFYSQSKPYVEGNRNLIQKRRDKAKRDQDDVRRWCKHFLDNHPNRRAYPKYSFHGKVIDAIRRERSDPTFKVGQHNYDTWTAGLA